MGGYTIEDVPHHDLSQEALDTLRQQNEEQAALMAEAIIKISEQDEPLGSISKIDAHQGAGVFHRAFSVLLFNTKGEMLLQQRSGERSRFPMFGRMRVAHTPYSPEELDEVDAMGVKQAALRKLEQELGIDPSTVSTDDMTFMTKMRYAARMNQEWIEREVDHILVMCADVEIDVNPNEVADVMWVNQEALEAMLIEDRPPEQAVAPWFRCIASHHDPCMVGGLQQPNVVERTG